MNTVSPLESASFPPSEPTTSPGTGIANLPNQRHKIVAKNGANFTLMVCGKFDKTVLWMIIFIFIPCNSGESGVGKTTFVNTLFTSTIKEPKNLNKRRTKTPSKTVQIQITRAGKIVIVPLIQYRTEPPPPPPPPPPFLFNVAAITTMIRAGRENVQG